MAVELFKISCTTCAARLVVRDEEVIGQILACPKCDSMVQVVPPPGWSAGQGAQVDGTPPTDGEPAPPTEAPARAAAAMAGASVATPEPSTASAEPVAAPAPEPVATNGPAPPLDAGGWTSPAELMWRKIAVWGAAGGIGVFLVGIALGLLLSRDSDDEAVAKALADEQAAKASEPADDETEADVLESPAENDTPPQDFPKAEPAEDVEAVSLPLPDEHDLPTESDSPAEQPDAETIEDKAPTEADDAQGEADDIDTNDAADDAADKATPDTDDVDELEPLAALLDPPAIEKPQGANSEVEGTAVIAVKQPGGAASPVDAKARLDFIVPRIEYRQTPLVDVLRMLSEMTGVAISLDIEAMARTGASPTTPVTLSKSDVKVGDVLQAVLAPARLGFKAGDDQIVVGPQFSSTQLRMVRYTVDDLASSTAEMDVMAANVRKLVAPTSWQQAGGQGTIAHDGGSLKVNQSLPVHYELVTFFEKLRRARGLPLRSRLSPERFELVDRFTEAGPLLDQSVTFTFAEPARLSEIVQTLESITGATVLLDWPSISSEGIRFQTEVACSVKERPLGEALTAILSPLRLTWRCVDGQTLQILGQARADSLRYVEFYKVDDIAQQMNSDAMLDTLRRGVAADTWSDQGVALHFDTAGESLIVRQSPTAHGEIGALLEAVRQRFEIGQ